MLNDWPAGLENKKKPVTPSNRPGLEYLSFFDTLKISLVKVDISYDTRKTLTLKAQLNFMKNSSYYSEIFFKHFKIFQSYLNPPPHTHKIRNK